MARVVKRVVLAVGTLFCLSAVVSAQQTSSATQTKKFEVISVTGNQLVVKLPEGTRELTVPDDFRFDVDGKQMSVHDLKPGMKGTAQITTKTTVTPVTVTEVKNGTVMQASGSSLIVKTEDGIKMFSPADVEKRNVRITRDGKPLDFSDLHSGDKLTATIVTSHPPRVVTEKQVQASMAREGGAARQRQRERQQERPRQGQRKRRRRRRALRVRAHRRKRQDHRLGRRRRSCPRPPASSRYLD